MGRSWLIVGIWSLVAAACGSPASTGASPARPTAPGGGVVSAGQSVSEPAAAVSAAASGLEVTPLSAILTPEGEPVVLSASAGPGQAVEWGIGDASHEGVVDLSIDGNHAAVAPGRNVGWAMVYATTGEHTVSVSVSVALPAAGTVVVPPTSIACGEAPGPGAVALVRTPLTESIAHARHAVGGVPAADCDGFIGSVDSVSLTADRVVVSLQKAALAEAFDEYVTRVIGDVLDARHLISQWWPDEECNVTGDLGFDVGVVDFAEVPLRIKPRGLLSVEGGALRELEFGVDVTTDLSVTGPLVTVTGSGTGHIGCRIELPEAALPPLAIGPFTIRPVVDTSVHVGVQASIQGTTVVRSAGLSYAATGSYGVRYDEAGGWTNTSAQPPTDPGVDAPALEEAGGEFSVGVDLGIGATAALVFGTLGLDQARVQFADASIEERATVAAPLAAFASPIPPPREAYQNPRWGVALSGAGHIRPGEPWAVFLPCLAAAVPDLPPDFETEVFSVVAEFGKTPDFLAAAEVVTGGRRLSVDGGELTWLERLIYAGAPVDFWNTSPPAPTLIERVQLGQDGRAELLVPDGGVPIFGIDVLWSDGSQPPSPSWFPVAIEPGHAYAVGVESPQMVPVSATLDHSLGFCATGPNNPSCRSAPAPNPDQTSMNVTISHDYFSHRNAAPSRVTVYDLGRGLNSFRAIIGDAVFSPVGLELQTQDQAVPSPG